LFIKYNSGFVLGKRQYPKGDIILFPITPFLNITNKGLLSVRVEDGRKNF
jgi:hypothetical protein